MLKFIKYCLLMFILAAGCAQAMSEVEFKKNIVRNFKGTLLASDINTVFENAIVVKVGDGSGKIMIFTDAYCPACSALYKNLKSIDNVTLYYLFAPLDGPGSKNWKVAESIVCSTDKEESFMRWANTKRVSESATCDNTLMHNREVFKSAGLFGTPAMVFGSGKMVQGSLSPMGIMDNIK